MGQFTSSEVRGDPLKESFSRDELKTLFQARLISLLSKGDLASLTSRVNMKDLQDSDAVLTISEFGSLLRLDNSEDRHTHEESGDKKQEEEGSSWAGKIREESSLEPIIGILYRSFTILGRLPFLASADMNPEQLTIKKLLVALAVNLGAVSKIWHDFSYIKTFFISLALSSLSEVSKESNEKRKSQSLGPKYEKGVSELGASHKTEIQKADRSDVMVEVFQNRPAGEDAKFSSRRVQWNKLDILANYDGIEVDDLTISASEFSQVLTLVLIVNSIPSQSHMQMQDQLRGLTSNKWKSFESISVSILRYIDVNINEANFQNARISFTSFCDGIEHAMDGFLSSNLKKLFNISLTSKLISESHESLKDASAHKKSVHAFNATRLVDEATISLIALFLRSTNSTIEITPQNMVELYNGAHSGFSIRSLELKIFKWQAPTILLVSGKRLRSKTITKNKRYQQFDAEYPRFFRSSEDPKKDWQSDTDRITYAVFVNQPWRSSNKNNFGDEETSILAIHPRYDFFHSRTGLLSAGRLIYFNNQGMGLGVGNEQPVNKNHIRKYMPGSVSLTIEANLEFGVFRHIANASASTPRFFEKSTQKTVADQDYEDRFIITDLEVWGVGSTKELSEQRKQWEWEEKQAQARQGVNLKNLGEERAFLEMAGLVGNQGSGGSV